jgi:hypothetical protein
MIRPCEHHPVRGDLFLHPYKCAAAPDLRHAEHMHRAWVATIRNDCRAIPRR